VYLNDTRLNCVKRIDVSSLSSLDRCEKGAEKEPIKNNPGKLFCPLSRLVLYAQFPGPKFRQLDPGLKLGIRGVHLDSW
jgi:hypothetical protein